MANETPITVIGYTTAPAELRFTQSGSAVANFTVASTPRTFDKQTNEWKDGETLFLRCSVWREQAENVAETFKDKGMGIIVQGNLKQRSYDKDGDKRTVYELDVQDVGPSLKRAVAQVSKVQRNGNNAPQQANAFQPPVQQATPQPNGGGQWAGQPAADPWGPNQSQVPF